MSFHAAESGRSLLAHITLLFCIGWILNYNVCVNGAPVIETGADVPKPSGKESFSPVSNNDDVHGVMISTNNKTELEPESIPWHNDENPPTIILHESLVHQLQGNLTDGKVAKLVYEPGIVIRCDATGSPKPNVTWIYEGGTFSDFVLINCFHHDSANDFGGNTSSVKLTLPMMNNAFYGKVICVAENEFGNDTLEILLIPNANSSAWMKTVRCVLSGAFLLVCILFAKLIVWMDKRREDKRYERLAPQDLEVINKFKKGLVPPPPSPSSSMVVDGNTGSCLLGSSTSCVKGLNEKVSTLGKCENSLSTGNKDCYRTVKRDSSSPDFQHRLLTGGTSTPSTCSSNLGLDAVNTWTNYCPYDDKMELSSQHFTVDFTTMYERGSYGIIFAGKVRNDLTMEWSTVGVKCGKTQRNEENFPLESLLTELKILASLPRQHDSIVNLRGAYTKTLHKRQAFIFVDYCENGNLASFIDLNKETFNKIFDSKKPSESCASKCESSAGDTKITFTEETGVTIDCHTETNKMELSFIHLLLWAKQVADGMHFLHKKRILHGNLSTANIYVTAGLKVKIGNIGYSSSPEEGCLEGFSKKWLTVPHYCFEQFSKRSDIWDYGRVLWEVFSFGGEPCPDNGTIVDYMHYYNDEDEVFSSEEIGIPKFATEDIYELMMLCWNENATLCPEFDVFVKAFRKMLKAYQA